MKHLIILWLSVCIALPAAGSADQPDSPELTILEAERLSRDGQSETALTMARKLAEEAERRVAAGDKPPRWGMLAFQLAARIAREDFLDFAGALELSQRMLELATTDYWRVPARLELARTYRAMGKFPKAREEYDRIAAADERLRPARLLPHAEMVYFELQQEDLGRRLLKEGLMHEDIAGYQRYRMVEACARHAIEAGRPEEALGWFGLVPDMPFAKPNEHDRFLSQAWLAMGRIEETRGRTKAAKALYRKAFTLESGDPRSRVQARDALERIDYFE